MSLESYKHLTNSDQQLGYLLELLKGITERAEDVLDDYQTLSEHPGGLREKWLREDIEQARQIYALHFKKLGELEADHAERLKNCCHGDHKCCERADEYNGYGSGPVSFFCPHSCQCHD